MTGRYRAFGPFCLDLLDERLWRAETCLPLGRRAFAVLVQLVDHPNQLVTKEQLLASVWPDTSVSEAVLTTAMREIRAALADMARTPRFVATVYGRGYRFVAPVIESGDDPRRADAPRVGAGDTRAPHVRAVPDRDVVGRELEWTCLRQWYDDAERGSRRIAFIAGEAGIGKTALVDAFVAGAADGTAVGRGQCIEQYGSGEAYLPVLEAIGRLARDPTTGMARVLRDHAPSWLAHLPSLPDAPTVPTLTVRPERMLRELAEALEVFTAADPLVLVLEDLHWSDCATLEWLSYVARRRDPARLLVLATFRPVEALVHESPLRRTIAELRNQPQVAELVLDYLPREDVRAYLRRHCGEHPQLEALASMLHQRTGGHPLFLASITDDLVRRGLLTDRRSGEIDLETMAYTLPLNVRQFLEHRLERLSDGDRAILEVASVAGECFAVTAVAAVVAADPAAIDARCSALARTHGILLADNAIAGPGGTRIARYRFRHALFRETAYADLHADRRAQLHLAIGRDMESVWAKHTSAIASELAAHFEQAHDTAKSVAYRQEAARHALLRSAYAEAHGHLARAIELVRTLPDSRARLRREATLSLMLAQVLETTRGWAAEDVRSAYAHARALCVRLGDRNRVLQATWGVIAVSVVRGQLHRTQKLSLELLRLARKRQSRLYTKAAHTELGGTALALGRTASARRHFRLAAAIGDSSRHQSAVDAFGMDLDVFSRMWATHLLWYEGHPDRAWTSAREAMVRALEIDHPFTRTVTLAYAAMLGQFRRDVAEVDRLTRAAFAHATEHGFPYYRAWAEVLQGWSRAARGAGEEAIADMRRGIAALQASARLRLPYYRALLAESCGCIGRVDEGLDVLVEAFDDIRGTDERWWEPELHRIRGELLRLAARPSREPESCFRMAIDRAVQQRTRSLELRAAIGLARMQRDPSAHRLLAQTYGRFTEGFDTPDLIEAAGILAESGTTKVRRSG